MSISLFIRLCLILLAGHVQLVLCPAFAVIVTSDPAELPLPQQSTPKPGIVMSKQPVQKSDPSKEQLLIKRATDTRPDSRSRKEAALAQLELGSRMLDGLQGAQQNVNAAYKWFVLAANQSDARIASLGALGAGCALMLHTDSPAQAREAQVWLDKARKAGLARADYVEALALWRRSQGKRLGVLDERLASATRSQDAMATNMQAVLLESEGKTQAAQTVYALAAGRGSAAAAINLERLRIQQFFSQYLSDRSRFTGLSSMVGEDEAAAVDPRKIKLTKELAYEFARRYHTGRGIQVDYLQAVALYERAATERHEPSRKMLALIMSRRDKRGALDVAWMRTLAQVDTSNTSVHTLRGDFGYPVVDHKPCDELLALNKVS